MLTARPSLLDALPLIPHKYDHDPESLCQAALDRRLQSLHRLRFHLSYPQRSSSSRRRMIPYPRGIQYRPEADQSVSAPTIA